MYLFSITQETNSILNAGAFVKLVPFVVKTITIYEPLGSTFMIVDLNWVLRGMLGGMCEVEFEGREYALLFCECNRSFI